MANLSSVSSSSSSSSASSNSDRFLVVPKTQGICDNSAPAGMHDLCPKYSLPEFDQANENAIQHKLDELSKRLCKWVKTHESNLRPSLNELIRKVSLITHAEFRYALARSILIAEQSYQPDSTLDWNKTIWLVEGGKSNKWVADIALSILNQRQPNSFVAPAAVYRLGIGNAAKFAEHLVSSNAEELAKFKGKEIVLWDDGSFSGAQLANHIKAIIELNINLKLGIKSVIAVVPYMTQCARNKIVQLSKTYVPPKNPELIYGNYANIPSLSELSKGSQALIKQMWGYSDDEMESLGLTAFSHKTPNDQSFPDKLAKGMVYKAVDDEFVSDNALRTETLEPVQPPYKSGFPETDEKDNKD